MTTKKIIPIATHVIVMKDFVTEYDATMNRLRIADAATDKTIHVFTDEALYRIAPAAPAGHLWICPLDEMPEIAASLINAGIVEYVRQKVDSITGDIITLVRPIV